MKTQFMSLDVALKASAAPGLFTTTRNRILPILAFGSALTAKVARFGARVPWDPLYSEYTSRRSPLARSRPGQAGSRRRRVLINPVLGTPAFGSWSRRCHEQVCPFSGTSYRGRQSYCPPEIFVSETYPALNIPSRDGIHHSSFRPNLQCDRTYRAYLSRQIRRHRFDTGAASFASFPGKLHSEIAPFFPALHLLTIAPGLCWPYYCLADIFFPILAIVYSI